MECLIFIFCQHSYPDHTFMPMLLEKFGSLLPLFGLLALMYFMVIKPQQNRARQHQALLAALGPGDQVITSSGILGVIETLDPTHIQLRIAPEVLITLERAHIAKITRSAARPNSVKTS